MAEKVMAQIADEMKTRWPISEVAIVHRTGVLEIGQASVAIAVSAPHRGEAFAASPTLTGVAPRGGQRGTEITLTLTGDRLDDAKELLFYDPGFTVIKLEPNAHFQVGEDLLGFVMTKQADGTIVAGHSSHSSHASHASHASSR